MPTKKQGAKKEQPTQVKPSFPQPNYKVSSPEFRKIGHAMAAHIPRHLKGG